jgi:hypothetical protein
MNDLSFKQPKLLIGTAALKIATIPSDLNLMAAESPQPKTKFII